jgi:hypothetical protein
MKKYSVFNWIDLFVFILIGFLFSGLIGVVFPVPHIVAFPIGFSMSFITVIKYREKEINKDLNLYFEFKNKIVEEELKK